MGLVYPSLDPEMVRPRSPMLWIIVSVEVGGKATFGAKITIATPATSADGDAHLRLINVFPMNSGVAMATANHTTLQKWASTFSVITGEVAFSIIKAKLHPYAPTQIEPTTGTNGPVGAGGPAKMYAAATPDAVGLLAIVQVQFCAERLAPLK